MSTLLEGEGSILRIARSYLAAGYSLVPVRVDGSKAPSLAWKIYQSRQPSETELIAWFGGTALQGIALVHGAISGGSEVLDFDDPAAFEEFSSLCDDHGLGELVARCVQVATPTGGWHLYFRSEGAAEGNQKLARKPDGGVRIETRGEGGYTLAPGCPPQCHPSGKPYRRRAGSFLDVPVFSGEERGALLAMARACNQRAEEVARGQVATGEAARAVAAGDDSPGNDFNARATQGDVLELLLKHGWQEVGRRGDAIDLRRPGKSVGISATLGYVAPGVFFPFSSNAAPFDDDRAYAPFSVFGLLEHGGDFAAAARALGERGYGRPLDTGVKPQFGTSRSAFNKVARELPRITLTGKQLPEKSDEAMAALRAANNPPAVFVKAGQLVRIAYDPDGRGQVQPLSIDSLRGILARAATWWTVSEKSGERAVAPPDDVVRDILSRPEIWGDVPHLETITATPCLTQSGELVESVGYLPSARLLWTGAIQPSEEAMTLSEAKALLFDQLLSGFPFKDQASRAHAIALALLPIVRLAIPGATPLHFARASTPGTGKSLLIETLTSIVVPGGAPASPCPSSEQGLDEEMRKRITSVLLAGGGHVWLDNIKRHLDSPALALALTQSVWSDRALGANTQLHLPIRCVWCATGNNPTISDEISRRTVFISLDANMERPWDRESFKIEDLAGFVRQERPRLLSALLTLVKAWIDAGRPQWRGRRLGSFDGWCRVMGGILMAAGIDGFLDNLDANDQADPDRARWAAFLELWNAECGEEPVGVGDVIARAIECDIVAEDTVKEKQKLGYRLRAHQDRVFGHLRLEAAPQDKHTKAARYRVVEVEGALFAGTLSESAGTLRGLSPEKPKVPAENQGSSPSTEEPFAGTCGDLRGLFPASGKKVAEGVSRAPLPEKSRKSPQESPVVEKKEEEYKESPSTEEPGDAISSLRGLSAKDPKAPAKPPQNSQKPPQNSQKPPQDQEKPPQLTAIEAAILEWFPEGGELLNEKEIGAKRQEVGEYSFMQVTDAVWSLVKKGYLRNWNPGGASHFGRRIEVVDGS